VKSGNKEEALQILQELNTKFEKDLESEDVYSNRKVVLK